MAENPNQFSADELGIVDSWRYFIHDNFYIFRDLQKYTVFLTAGKQPALAYGVLAFTEPFSHLIGYHRPQFVRTMLLPFKDVIIYDSLIRTKNISFGGGIKRMLNETYKAAKAHAGIITSLPMSARPTPSRPPKPKSAPAINLKAQTNAALRDVTDLLDQFCKEYLNDEYAVLCRKMAEKLARKRPSPLLKGNPNAWASAIVRAIGFVNFLHDKTQEPYMRSADIDAAFGVGTSTAAAKLAAIRKMFKLYQFDPNWSLPSRLEDNPLVWMLQVDGFVMDIRKAPRELQEIAFRKGYIPYIPADREQEAQS